MNPPPLPKEAIASVVANIGPQTGLFIDGQYQAAADNARIAVENPATGDIFVHVAAAGVADIDRAVTTARRAFDLGPWRRMPANERAAILHRFADAVDAAGDELGILETLDNGMPFPFARFGSVKMGAEALRYYAGWPMQIAGETLPVSAPGEWMGYTLRQPVGVVGVISAWNFPLAMACGKIAPALAAGCTVVLNCLVVRPHWHNKGCGLL